MITETVEYTDFLDQKRTKKLHFHIGVATFLDNFDLERELREIQAISEGDLRQLGETEIRKILEAVKRIIRMGYGVRSDDGDRFSQTEEHWMAFRESAAYDKFLLELFTDTKKANAFIAKVMTVDLRNAALAQATPEQLATLGEDAKPVDEDNRPAWLRENRPPSVEEFKATPPEYHAIAFEMRANA